MKALGFISSISAIIGTVFWFINPTITIICAVISALNSIVQVCFGEQTNLVTEIATIIISAIIALIAKTPIFITICFGICITDAVMSILGWITMFVSYKNFYK